MLGPQQLSRFPRWCNDCASPKHLPLSLCRWRCSASRLLNALLHPPTMRTPSNSNTGPARTTAAGTPSSAALRTGTPQHTQSATSSSRVCVLMCRLRSGERRLRCTYGQWGHCQALGAGSAAPAGAFLRWDAMMMVLVDFRGEVGSGEGVE